jgi:hypothetical protein
MAGKAVLSMVNLEQEWIQVYKTFATSIDCNAFWRCQWFSSTTIFWGYFPFNCCYFPAVALHHQIALALGGYSQSHVGGRFDLPYQIFVVR